MELNNKTKQLLYIIAAGVVQAVAMVLIYFAEYYIICVDNNKTVFWGSVVISDILLYIWLSLNKKADKLEEDKNNEE